MKAIFSVQTIDRNTGKESTVRVEAGSKEEAIARVVALGEVAGACTLVEVLDSAVPVAPPLQTPLAVPGVVRCPKCGRTEWRGSRGCLFWGLVVILFPIGLLLLFITPTWTCCKCRYSFRSANTPVSLNGAGASVGGQLVRGVLIAVAVVLVGLLVLGILAELGNP